MGLILEDIKTDLDLDKVNLAGIMGRYLKEIGKMDWKMDMEFGDRLMDIITKENGCKIGNMDMGYLNIIQVHIKGSFVTS